MKTLSKALLWGAGFEVLLLMLYSTCHLGADYVPGAALILHIPAIVFLQRWPTALDSWAPVVLVQWCIWFLMFALLFAMLRWFKLRAKPTA